MRRKWPFLLLAFTLTVGLSVPGVHEVRASEGDSQLSIDRAGENLSLGADGSIQVLKMNREGFCMTFRMPVIGVGKQNYLKRLKTNVLTLRNHLILPILQGIEMQHRLFKRQLMLLLR